VSGGRTGCVRRIAVLIGLIACFSHSSFARAAKDVVVMKNGDRITCEIKSLQNGVLKVSLDYVDGSISVNWLKVARVESSYLFIVSLQDGSIFSAKLITPESKEGELTIQPEGGGESRSVDRSAVVTISQTSEDFLQRFGGSIALNSSYSKGNHNTQYNLASSLTYQRTRWGATVQQNSNLASSTGAETSTRNQLDLGAYRMLSRTNYFVGGIGTFLQSSVQGIDRQTNLGLGLGRYFKNTNRLRFWLLGGAGWQRTSYVPAVISEPPQDLVVGLFSANLEAFSFKKTRFDLTAAAYPALSAQKGRTFFKTNATYYL
jgi:hypothetical protein